jgi:hypothetical protein
LPGIETSRFTPRGRHSICKKTKQAQEQAQEKQANGNPSVILQLGGFSRGAKVMIDTIGLMFACVKIAYAVYSKWADEHHFTTGKGYVSHLYGFSVSLSNRASIRYTYLPYEQGGLLKIEFSLPNLIYGNNVQMIHDIKEAIDTANSKMPEIRGIPKLDLWLGKLYRLDICYNFQAGILVSWYIKALLMLEYPYRRTRPYTSQGVQYENNSVILRFYDKARERKDLNDPKGAKLALGILRVEVELKKLYIQKLTGCKKPILRTITLLWAINVLENELRQLNMLDQPIGTVDSTFKVLQEKYGHWEALALIGLLKTKMAYPSTELLAQDAKLHKNSIGRHIQKKFAENGLPATLTEYVEPLPPLTIRKKVDFDS